MCMSLFGQLLTHPSRVTFPWSALRHALNSYFASPPHLIDPAKIGSGWNGLSLILTSFKRLEVVSTPEETEEVLLWLSYLKAAAVKRSLQFEITAQPTLQDILSNLLEPISEEELALGRARQTHASKGVASTSSAAAMVYDPFAFEDLSNSAPRKRSTAGSNDASTSYNRARPAAGHGAENGMYEEEFAEVEDVKRKPVASSSRRTAATSSSRRGADLKTSQYAQRLAETHTANSSPASSTSSKSKPSAKKPSSQKVVMIDGPDGVPIKKVTRIQRPHDPNRPNFSYSALIGQAILSAPLKRLRLSEIYDFVTHNYHYYKKNECGWQNSIRHNLSLQPVFRKIPDNTIPGKKGCFWTIIPSEEWRFAGGGWTKLEKGQSSPVVAHGKKGKKGATHSSPSGANNKRKAEVMVEEEEDDFDDDEGDGLLYNED